MTDAKWWMWWRRVLITVLAVSGIALVVASRAWADREFWIVMLAALALTVFGMCNRK